jgi:hypothetical protein
MTTTTATTATLFCILSFYCHFHLDRQLHSPTRRRGLWGATRRRHASSITTDYIYTRVYGLWFLNKLVKIGEKIRNWCMDSALHAPPRLAAGGRLRSKQQHISCRDV